MALLERTTTPPPAVQLNPAQGHIRRCTFRRVSAVPRGRDLPLYEVACLFPDRVTPIPLGDLETARDICQSCTAQGVFRPDSD
ncbi:MAG: hypothetical protein M3253_06360 [Chloroflexota bacterium]|nr:hypothetical protein [Chloroflexota bacterium]